MSSNTSAPYSLSKCRTILKTGCKWYEKKRASLSSDQLAFFETHLQALDDACLKRDQNQANQEARLIEDFVEQHFKKSLFDYFSEIGLAILVALVIATVVRACWFENYEIPTGSMRPTFEEQDHLTVTKTAFGINVPLATEHFYFDPNLVQRTSIVIWSGENVPHLNSESKFMGLIPYTKRFIKRCMGKPGDTIYFYGGKIYAFDENGTDLIELRDSKWLGKLDHIPFTHFEGRRSYSKDPLTHATSQVVFNLMNQPIGRLKFLRSEMRGEIFNGSEWIKDEINAQKAPHDEIKTYSDFWGLRNYATTRILDADQLKKLAPRDLLSKIDKGILYLELRHTPSLSAPQPAFSNTYGVMISGFSTFIPLNESHLKALMENMYTCRFIVKNGKAHAYRLEDNDASDQFSQPTLPGVPDGVYEFYYGKAYNIGWGAIASELPKNHPLYSLEPKHIQQLYNIGIDMTTYVEPTSVDQYFPSRYAYFRDGSLYTMGGNIFTKDDPVLIKFNQFESQREQQATEVNPYVAFRDYGPPLDSAGELDKAFLKIFGYKIPQGKYLMLGDNHAMSQDSRWFGPVPAANLQGAPSLILWPPGPRWGIPLQKPYPIINIPRLIIWSIAGTIFLIWYFIHRRNLKKPHFKKKAM